MTKSISEKTTKKGISTPYSFSQNIPKSFVLKKVAEMNKGWSKVNPKAYENQKYLIDIDHHRTITSGKHIR